MPDYMLVVDVESTCWENHLAPVGEQTEIIEVGVCLLNLETFTPSDKKSLLIKPTRSTVSPFCTELTSITPEMVEDGMSLAEACAILESDYHASERIWGSWGDYDRRMFTNQCRSYRVNYPFSTHHLNIKNIFADLHQLRRRVGMTKALDWAQLPIRGRHHRGVDDAWNIAYLTGHLLDRFGRAAVLNLV